MTRFKEFAAMVLIGDGILGLLAPAQHVARWRVGPWREALGWAEQRPEFVRAIAAGEVVVAVWFARRLSVEEP